MKKLLILILLLPFFTQAQTYQLNYDSIRVGETAGTSGIALYGDVYLKNTTAGLSTDSIVVWRTGRLYRRLNTVPAAALSATSPIFYDSGTGVISSQAASSTLEGYITTGAQTLAGNKTLNGTLDVAGNIQAVTSSDAAVLLNTTGTLGVTKPVLRYRRSGVDLWAAGSNLASGSTIEDYEVVDYGIGAGTTVFKITRATGVPVFSQLTSNGLLKTSGGTGTVSVATAGTDYQAPLSGTGIVKSTAGTISYLTDPLPIGNGGTGNTSGTATTNANLTGVITSVGNATSIASQTGTGTTFAMSASPTFTGTLSGAAATFSGQFTSTGVAVFKGVNPGGIGANAYVADFSGGSARFFSYGPDISTGGGYLFYIQSSDGSVTSTPLSIAPTGAATFSGTVTAPKLNITEGSGGFAGQTTLVAGTKAITISGVTTLSRAFVTLVGFSGAGATTWYQAVCTANTLTIQADLSTGLINNLDTSTLNYFIIN